MNLTKTHPLAATAIAILTATLVAAPHAEADIIGMNATSQAGIRFDDSGSFAGGFPGAIYPVSIPSGWTGATLPLTQTDGTTGDYANGGLGASWSALSYAFGFLPTTLTQVPGNTGLAEMKYGAKAAFQTDLLGFAAGAMVYPAFTVDGTVQPGGFATIYGTIDYYINYIGAVSVPDGTVSYSYQVGNLTLLPTSFSSVPVPSFPSVSGLPAVPAGGTLTLIANFTFWVDPATITVTTVPEPDSALLLLGSGLMFALRRRRATV